MIASETFVPAKYHVRKKAQTGEDWRDSVRDTGAAQIENADIAKISEEIPRCVTEPVVLQPAAEHAHTGQRFKTGHRDLSIRQVEQVKTIVAIEHRYVAVIYVGAVEVNPTA